MSSRPVSDSGGTEQQRRHVVAASREAKALGKPWFELRPHTARLGLTSLCSNYEL